MKTSIKILVPILIIISSGEVLGGTRQCTKIEAMEAEDATSQLPNWKTVYEVYKKYGHCDDGSIGEGFSDGIVKLLANKWDKINELEIIINKDNKFKIFILKHINGTTDINDLNNIINNANKLCQKGRGGLCKIIIKKANKAIKEIKDE